MKISKIKEMSSPELENYLNYKNLHFTDNLVHS